MYFSDAYPAAAGDLDFFDLLLETDTQLFVDPFLVFAENAGFWEHADQRLTNYFQLAFEMLAGHHNNAASPQFKKTVKLMSFPEPNEFNLGFVAKGDGGSGTGGGFAKRMVGAMALAIEQGLSDLRHFEELSLLVERIGRDRISDITCNILKPMFIEYTQNTCRQLNIPLVSLVVPHSLFDPMRKRWVDESFDLPVNPINGRAVLLCPKRFLRELPSLNVDDWWDYVEPELREDLNLTIGDKLSKHRIIELARSHPDLVRQWTESRESREPDPYDVTADPEGLHRWQELTRDAAALNPLTLSTVDSGDLDDFIREVNEKFKKFVEDQGGWRLLWNDDSKQPKRETSIQLLYKGIIQSYCAAYGVVLDREVELGKGPVDFVFTESSTSRALLEIKKMQNGEYWNGLESQLTSYLESDSCDHGWFLAVRFGDSQLQKDRTRQLSARTREAARITGFRLSSMWVDARWKLSASELKPGGPTTVAAAEDDEFDDSGPGDEGSA